MKFRISAEFSPNETLKFIERNSNISWSVEVIPDAQEAAQTGMSVQIPGALYQPTRVPRQRKSKVTAAILDALAAGNGQTADLKKALSDAGMSPTSLPGALSLLQKAGTIKRSEAGGYELAAAE